MIEFELFQSKPITRMAFQLSELKHQWVKIGEAEYFVSENTINTTNVIKFKAHEEPQEGDWIVRVTDEDIYHCTDKVFRERNVV